MQILEHWCVGENVFYYVFLSSRGKPSHQLEVFSHILLVPCLTILNPKVWTSASMQTHGLPGESASTVGCPNP